MSGTEWETFCSEVTVIADRYSISVFTYPGILLLPSGSPSFEDQAGGSNPHIKLEDMGDASVRIETGWCIKAIADYEIQSDDGQSQAAAAVEAIIQGGAEEYVIIDEDDHWVGFGWHIQGDGFSMSQPPHTSSGRKAVRRLQPWRPS